MGLSSTAGLSVDHTRAASPVRSPSSQTASLSAQTDSRQFEIAALRPDGARHISQVRVPAIPLFEHAFSAFARGTIVQAEHGETAIEDLQPGDCVWTNSGTPAQVRWIGCGSFLPADASGRRTPLVRIMADTFGEGRPDSFLTLGPAARILQTPPHLRGAAGSKSLLTPIHEFIDGVNVIEVVPPTAVTLFHLVLDRHAAIRAGGVICETFHPGGQGLRTVSHATRDLFLSMFPDIAHATDFGPLAHARAPEHTFESA